MNKKQNFIAKLQKDGKISRNFSNPEKKTRFVRLIKKDGSTLCLLPSGQKVFFRVGSFRFSARLLALSPSLCEVWYNVHDHVVVDFISPVTLCQNIYSIGGTISPAQDAPD